ncbi:pentapeptide repeat-containing protein [Streptomyces koyangensis]|uniref:pentapeptide repeat-containing protein n=1 Tax=Streptomyces koyangensis TaxID=188770 RepID=UPI003C2EC3C3
MTSPRARRQALGRPSRHSRPARLRGRRGGWALRRAASVDRRGAERAQPRERLDWARRIELVSVLLASFVAVAGLWYSNIQSARDRAQFRQEFELSREGQVTDRYTAAIENLGKDTPEVRLGGIYALQRIMEDSTRDQPSVASVLAAYVRGHADKDSAKGGRVAADVQAALTIIAGRDTAHDRGFRPVLSRAWLPRVNLNPVYRPGQRVAQLANSSLAGSYMPYANAQRADLRGAFMPDAVLTNAMLSEADLRGAWLDGADLTNAFLTDADLRGTKMESVILDKASMAGADLRKAFMVNVSLRDTHLHGADLSGADLSGSDLREVSLFEADLRGTVLDNTQLRKGGLFRADLRGASLKGADLRDVSLVGADLRGADLTGADLRGADLGKARTTGAIMPGSDGAAEPRSRPT